MFESLTQSKKIIKDSILNLEVNQLGKKVTQSVENSDFKFNFYIIEDTILNAFALPGGNVVIHSGLILRADNAEEVLGVLGHEIAHVTQRHHARGLISQMGMSFIINTRSMNTCWPSVTFNATLVLSAPSSRFSCRMSTFT